jgi:hypothetical protein
MSRTGAVWNALIRTHHITSKKKISNIRQAAGDNALFVLLRSGRSPGIMYVEGTQDGVEKWVSVVQVSSLQVWYPVRMPTARHGCIMLISDPETALQGLPPCFTSQCCVQRI